LLRRVAYPSLRRESSRFENFEDEIVLCVTLLQLMEQVEAAYRKEAAEGRQLEAEQLAEQLVQGGHSVTVRTALGGGGGCECLRNLRHVFLSVQMQVMPPPLRTLFDGATSARGQLISC
jgi:hypothetical protein